MTGDCDGELGGIESRSGFSEGCNKVLWDVDLNAVVTDARGAWISVSDNPFVLSEQGRDAPTTLTVSGRGAVWGRCLIHR